MPDSNVTAADLVRYSVALGVRGFRRGSRGRAAWRVWMPLDVDRVVELPWVASQIARARPGRVLDLASPKLLACWLAEHCPGLDEVVATDLWEREIDGWRRLAAAASRGGRRFDRLRLEGADARRLPYPDQSFDAIYSASAIEHIPDDGDIAAAAEMARVLRPGGVAALTVPYGRVHRDEHVEHDLYGQRHTGEPLFFQRHYAADSIDRLLAGGALEVVERGLWRKRGVKQAQGALQSIVPAGWEIGRFLGPALLALGAGALEEAPVDEPGEENVLRLLLRRR